VDGKLIKEIITPGGKVGLWDGTDSDGSYVSSGIYIVAAYSEDGNEVGIGKIAVVRK
jgi:flagellar hook assembly protein FlgD